MSLTEGVHDSISPEVYHGDPCDEPSLSQSTIKVLLGQSPLHAWIKHPRLNPQFKRETKDDFDLGTAAHDLFFEGGEKIAVIEGFDNWKSKAAQTARDAAREANLTPILEKYWVRTNAMVEAIRDQLAIHEADPPLFDAGTPEVTLVWRDKGTGVLCRARLDWLRDDFAAIDDLKTTGLAANAWPRRTLWNKGGEIQAAFYLRGLAALHPGVAQFRFCAVENTPPYGLMVYTLSPEDLLRGDEKVQTALERWRQCLDSGIWPAYSRSVIEAKSPPWSEGEWLEQQMLEDVTA